MSVLFLRERLRLVPAVSPSRLTQLVAELDSERFDIREKAGRELVALGNVAESILNKAAREHPSPEVRRRAQLILTRHEIKSRWDWLRSSCICDAFVFEVTGNPSWQFAELVHESPQLSFQFPSVFG